MGKMIQIRNVPDALHRAVKSRAALAGMSLSDYLLAAIKRFAELPTEDELRRRLASNDAVEMRTSSAEIIRENRDAA